MTPIPNSLPPVFPSPPYVKVCGLTRHEDAALSLELGATFLGFIFAEKTPRVVDPLEVQQILEALRHQFAPETFHAVGVFVSDTPEKIEKIVSQCNLSAVQIHGEITEEYHTIISVPIIPAIRVKDETSIQEASQFLEQGPVLLDTYVKGQHGGTGKTFQHEMALPLLSKGKVLIAGGLGPETILPTLVTFRELGTMPYAFDLSSGLEEMPRIKSREKMKDFFKKYSAFFHED